jgi:chain length determinant protein tyrosine kinase EpsG
MKIKTLMDFLNKDSAESRNEQEAHHVESDPASSCEEKVIYIENARLETVRDQSERRDLLASGTQWADQSMGDILIDLGKLDGEGVDRIISHQREKGLYFGEAAVELDLVDQEDILQALSIQFGYTYDRNEEGLSKEMVMAYSPFGEQAEEFRAIRSQLLNNWLQTEQKTLAIVSPESKEGRSYIAANLALAFSQLGRPTLLIDADLRSPRQHAMFNFTRRLGLSMLLAGRVRVEDLDVLPDQISNFQHLWVLGCGAVPPNPVELLSKGAFSFILRELKKYFDVIIIDTPPATYKADVVSIASIAGSALLVARRGQSKMEDTKNLTSVLTEASVKVVGAVLNQY